MAYNIFSQSGGYLGSVKGNRDSSYSGVRRGDAVYQDFDSVGNHVQSNLPSMALNSGGSSMPFNIVLNGANMALNNLLNSESLFEQLEDEKKHIQTQAGLYNYGLEYNRLMQQEANALTYATNQEANKHEEDMVRLANQFNVEQWERNNAYNSPSSQLQRAAEAGINPNMVFGSPVSSQPVQQTSIPSSHVGSYGAASSPGIPDVRLKYDYSSNRNMASMLSETAKMLMNIPEYELKIKGMKEDVRAKRLENDEREDANNLYSHMSFIINPNDPSDIVTVDNFEKLSPAEQNRYIKDGTSAPDTVVLPFKGKKGYEAFMDAINLRRNLVDSEADISQNRLRKLVSEGQLSDNDVVKSLIDMPKESFDALKKSISKIDSDISHTSKSNEYMDKAIEKLDEEIKEMKDSSLTGYISKITEGNMSMEDWLKAALVTLLRVTKR